MRLRPQLGAVLALAAALAPGPAAAAEVGTPACRRDLLVTESALRRALERLGAGGSSEAARCEAWREHGRSLDAAIAVYQRCLTEPDRSARLGPLRQRAAEFRALLASRCRGG